MTTTKARTEELIDALSRTLAAQSRVVNELVAEAEAWVEAAPDERTARTRRRRIDAAIVEIHDSAFEIDTALALGGVCPAPDKRRPGGPARAAAVDLGQMYEAGQITLAERNAAEHISRLFARRQLYEGVKSVLGNAGETTGGGRDYDLLTVRRLDAAKAWVDLAARITSDIGASQYASERQTWPAVLEAVLADGMSFTLAARRLGVGKRDMVRKRFRRALTAAARALGAGDLRPRSRAWNDGDRARVMECEDSGAGAGSAPEAQKGKAA